MNPVDVARAIAERRCPVPAPVDWVVLGRVLRKAKAAGLIRDNHGCFDDWGGYSVTEEGKRALQPSA